MKKKLSIALIVATTAALTSAVWAFAATDIKLFINGKKIEADLQIVDGSSYVPLRVVSESLGAEVKWDGDKREIHINGQGTAAPAKGDVKSFDVKVNVISGPMKLDISKVTFDPSYKPDSFMPAIKAIVLDATVENTSSDTVSWYPNHATIITNTKEQIEAKSFYSDLIGGDFIGKVVKTGKIVFEVKGDLSAVTSFNYKIDAPLDEKYYRIGEDKTVEVILK